MLAVHYLHIKPGVYKVPYSLREGEEEGKGKGRRKERMKGEGKKGRRKEGKGKQ